MHEIYDSEVAKSQKHHAFPGTLVLSKLREMKGGVERMVALNISRVYCNLSWKRLDTRID